MEYPNLSGDDFKRIVNLVKLIFGLLVGAILIILTVGLWVSFKDMSSLRAELAQRSEKMYEEVKDLRLYSQAEISKTQDYAFKQIVQIREEAKSLAINAARSEIAATFQRENILQLIDRIAEEKLKGPFTEILNKSLLEHQNILQTQVEEFPKISLAIDKIRFGSKEALLFIDSLRIYSDKPFIRAISNEIFETKSIDYRDTYAEFVKEKIPAMETLPSDDMVPYEYDPLFNLASAHIWRTKDKILIITKVIESIRASNDLNEVACGFLVLEHYSDKSFKMFDFVELENFIKNTNFEK